MLKSYPTLSHIVEVLDQFLREGHPSFFGTDASHPFSPLKPYKVIHDHLWGTNRFSWRELVLIDSPILQRLRGIHQTGLAYYVYPSAKHSRFEHSLGVLTVASRIFDSLQQRCPNDLETIARAVDAQSDPKDTLARLRQELRLAALLHDTGHSLHSHASERAYSNLGLLKAAAEELSSFVGKEKGSGEVLSFCIARTSAVAELLKRAEEKTKKKDVVGEFTGEIDLDNISLLVVGRSQHPFLQFLGDIISSGFDADKLDYLLRDAAAAGLPLRYDLERYLYTVYLEKNELTDDESELERLYERAGSKPERKPAAPPHIRFPYYDTYRLRLPKLAMSTIEQIIICKLMLFSYIYHHPKVRSAEGVLVHLLDKAVSEWQKEGETDEQIVNRFISMNDSALDGSQFLESRSKQISQYAYRVQNRLLPREIYRLSAAVSHAEGALVKNFFASLEDKAKRTVNIAKLENVIGGELLRLKPELGDTPEDALWNAGVWVDVPKVPKFEDISVLVGRTKDSPGVPIADVFPIGHWTEAYESHRFYVRIYSFSEYVDVAEKAARKGIEDVIGVTSDEFFQFSRKPR